MPPIFRHATALLCLCGAGCAMLNTDRSAEELRPSSERIDHTARSPTDAPIRRIIRLQASIASGSADDRRIRSQAWEELDESGLMSPEDRRRLNESGIRVGVSGSSLPWALSSLVHGEQFQINGTGADSPGANRTSGFGMHVTIPEGSNSLLELPAEESSLQIPAGEIAGLKNGAELTDAKCVFDMTAIDYGQGWVMIRFLPQIHHGNIAPRYSTSSAGVNMPTRQRIQPLYEQQFDIKLHVGETVVIGYQDSPDWTIGRMMLQEETLSAQREHLIALKLNDVEEITGQKSVTINYDRY